MQEVQAEFGLRRQLEYSKGMRPRVCSSSKLFLNKLTELYRKQLNLCEKVQMQRRTSRMQLRWKKLFRDQERGMCVMNTFFNHHDAEKPSNCSRHCKSPSSVEIYFVSNKRITARNNFMLVLVHPIRTTVALHCDAVNV